MNTEPVKVFLPGESLWAIPVQFSGDLMQAKLDNNPVSDLHGYSYGDLVTFKKHPKYGSWELAEVDEQL